MDRKKYIERLKDLEVVATNLYAELAQINCPDLTDAEAQRKAAAEKCLAKGAICLKENRLLAIGTEVDLLNSGVGIPMDLPMDESDLLKEADEDDWDKPKTKKKSKKNGGK